MAKDKVLLDLEVLSGVYGGTLPPGWESEMDLFIKMYKAVPDEEMNSRGYTKTVDDAVRYAIMGIKNELKASSEDCATVENYIRSHW